MHSPRDVQIVVALPYNNSTNSSTVNPASLIKSLSVPRFSSLWFGTESVAAYPTFSMMMWLPVCLLTAQPAFLNAFTAFIPDITGNFAIHTTTSIVSSSIPSRALRLITSMQPCIASLIFSSASSIVSPCE